MKHVIMFHHLSEVFWTTVSYQTVFVLKLVWPLTVTVRILRQTQKWMQYMWLCWMQDITIMTNIGGMPLHAILNSRRVLDKKLQAGVLNYSCSRSFRRTTCINLLLEVFIENTMYRHKLVESVWIYVVEYVVIVQ